MALNRVASDQLFRFVSMLTLEDTLNSIIDFEIVPFGTFSKAFYQQIKYPIDKMIESNLTNKDAEADFFESNDFMGN